jgi:hypothetical protein
MAKTNKLVSQKIAAAKKSEAVLPGIEAQLHESLKCAILTALIKAAEELGAEINTKESELDVVKEKQKVILTKINDFQKRLRAGAKSAFGDDSLEYERVGGKRASEHKKRAKKKSTSTAA